MSEGTSKRVKRRSRPVDTDETWECTACTYKNPKESFKCEVCDTRKGTSTRKPKLTNSVIQMQEQLEKVFSKDKDEEVGGKKRKDNLTKLDTEENKHVSIPFIRKLKNIDRSNFKKYEVTVNGVNETIKQYVYTNSKNNVTTSVSKSGSAAAINVTNTPHNNQPATLTTSSGGYHNNSTGKSKSRSIWSIANDSLNGDDASEKSNTTLDSSIVKESSDKTD